MAEVPAARKLIDEKETKYRASVAESTWKKIAGSINFIFRRNHQEKQFFINGTYSGFGVPLYMLDGVTVFQFDATIIGVYMYNMNAGSSGSTKIDCRRKPQNTGAWESIFSTPPEIAFGAGDAKWVGLGDSFPNMIAPVLDNGGDGLTFDVDAGDGLCIDLLTAQVGGKNCGLLIHYRPR